MSTELANALRRRYAELMLKQRELYDAGSSLSKAEIKELTSLSRKWADVHLPKAEFYNASPMGRTIRRKGENGEIFK